MNLQEFEALVGKYVEGECTEQEAEQLLAEIEVSPEARRLLTRHLYHEKTLVSLLAKAGEGATSVSSARMRAVRRIRKSSRRKIRPPRRGGWSWAMWASIAASVAVIAGAWYLNQKQAEFTPQLIIAHIDSMSGDVRIRREGKNKAIAASTGMKVEDNDTVVVPKGGSAKISYPEEQTAIMISPLTEVKLWLEKEGEERGKRVRVTRGAIECDVQKQPAGEPMVLLTDHARAEVLGTQFVLRAEDAKTRLEVTEGEVRLTRSLDKRSVDVTGGYYAEAGPGIDLALHKIEGDVPPSPATTKVLFADDFDNSPLGQWPRGWHKHQTEPQLRSGFVVVADPARPGARFIDARMRRGGSTQHAYLPITAWPTGFEVSFRMRLSGKANTRSGIEFYDQGEIQRPSIEYDASNSSIALMERRPTIRTLKRVPLVLEGDRWHEWKVTVSGNRFSVVIDGKPVAEMTYARCGRLERACVISRGRDPVHYDHVNVIASLGE